MVVTIDPEDDGVRYDLHRTEFDRPEIRTAWVDGTLHVCADPRVSEDEVISAARHQHVAAELFATDGRDPEPMRYRAGLGKAIPMQRPPAPPPKGCAVGPPPRQG